MKLKRSLKPEDLEEVFAITQSVGRATSWDRVRLSSEISVAESLALFEDQRLMAFVLYRQFLGGLEISWLATDPNQQRKGRMQDLLSELFAANSQAKEIWLEVHELNLEARNLYEKLGFKITGRRPAYYSDGGTALIMTKAGT
jgi:ribosomal-protein-alanine N-acetyltransferase